MTFFGVIGLSYQDISNDISGVVIRISVYLRDFFFLSFLFFSLSSIISSYWILCLIILQFKWVANDICYLWITDVICDSLNYSIFLNIFCIMLFYQKNLLYMLKKNGSKIACLLCVMIRYEWRLIGRKKSKLWVI